MSTSPPGPLSHLPPTLPRERGDIVRKGEAGYNLVVLIIAIAVLTIMLTAMLPLVSQEIRRDKEEELVFRGLQYAEAIRVFQIRYQRLPNKLSELVEVKPRSIRQLWKDPMTDDGKWGLIFQNQGQPLQPGQSEPGQQGRFQPSQPGQPSPGQQRKPGEDGDQGGPDQPTDQPDQPGLHVPRAGDTVQVGPIVGVYSKSHKKSILIFNGRERYDEWRFTVDMLNGQTLETGSPGVGGGTMGSGPILSTRWLGRPWRFGNQGGLPPGVQNGTMPGTASKPTGGKQPGQAPAPKPFGQP
jgi:type II secretory pathway pseudopilin PulG